MLPLNERYRVKGGALSRSWNTCQWSVTSHFLELSSVKIIWIHMWFIPETQVIMKCMARYWSIVNDHADLSLIHYSLLSKGSSNEKAGSASPKNWSHDYKRFALPLTPSFLNNCEYHQLGKKAISWLLRSIVFVWIIYAAHFQSYLIWLSEMRVLISCETRAEVLSSKQREDFRFWHGWTSGQNESISFQEKKTYKELILILISFHLYICIPLQPAEFQTK